MCVSGCGAVVMTFLFEVGVCVCQAVVQWS